MNYLLMCQTVGNLAGIPGCIPGVSPTTIVGAVGEFARVVGWVNIAWAEIQRHRADWQWMRKDFSFDTVTHTGKYTVAMIGLTDFGSWVKDSFRIYLASIGTSNEIFLDQKDYDIFRDFYLYGVRRTTYNRPKMITQAPDYSLILGFAPDNIYTVVGEYYTTVKYMTLDASIPEMPDRFHMAIVYRSLIKYGMYEAASEVIQENQTNYSEILNKMEIDQTPKITFGPSLI